MGVVLAAAAFWAGGLIQLWAGRRDSFRRRSASMFALFAVALTLDIDWPYRHFDRIVGRPNMADLISHLAGLIGIYLFWTMLRSVVVDDISAKRRRTELALLQLVLAATTGLFFMVRAPFEDANFSARYGAQLATKAYWALSTIYGATCLVQLGVTVARSARASSRKDVAIGLLVAAWGGIGFGAAYIALKLVQICSVGVSASLVDSTQRLQSIVLGPGMICLAGGLLLPVANRGARNGIDNLRVRHHLVRLRPLHEKLHSVGALRTDDPLSSVSSLWGDVAGSVSRERLLRRIVENQDALLAIRAQIADAAGSVDAFENAAKATRLSLDFGSAAALDRLAGRPSAAYAARRIDGMRKIDLFAEAKDLIELERAWRTELRQGEQ